LKTVFGHLKHRQFEPVNANFSPLLALLKTIGVDG